ncbi:quinone oxidoreductase [Methylobacterium sp. NEAU 140]|uniref:quinone oxidoreductase family protein n=1 Tax=Methylobacterium sp. NEAU 140 TaxID=3064945 RepID=UPI0027349783|nr:quinone oxidoreductase [Methylobacterium sp. NEAU 140]MDP4025586.1 quinone oxidoreductase [Methylobacterium sp. NEAU 140]
MTQNPKAIVVRAFGGPEVLRLEDVALKPPGPGEVLVRHGAVGFNYIDVYQRKGAYPLPLPTGLGHEAAGTIEAVGEGVTDLRAGDRVATINAGLGAYADRRVVPADRLVKLPDELDDAAAAAVIFKGLTAQYLLRRTHAVKAGETVLVHAAAGGVGQILSRWAKALGAFVVGTAGSEEKCAAARAAGCDVAIDYSRSGWPEALLAATGGRKARVVYDSVGRDTFLHSLDLAEPFGLVVSYGAASGPAPDIAPELLNKKGCLFLTRPSVFPHNADPARLRANAADLFDAVARGHVVPEIGARFPLSEAADAHRAAEARATTGAILLMP